MIRRFGLSFFAICSETETINVEAEEENVMRSVCNLGNEFNSCLRVVQELDSLFFKEL